MIQKMQLTALNKNLYIVIIIVWMMNFILYWCVHCMIFFVKTRPYFQRKPLIRVQTCSTFQLKNVKIMTNLGKYINNNLKIRDDLLPLLQYIIYFPLPLAYLYDICIV